MCVCGYDIYIYVCMYAYIPKGYFAGVKIVNLRTVGVLILATALSFHPNDTKFLSHRALMLIRFKLRHSDKCILSRMEWFE